MTVEVVFNRDMSRVFEINSLDIETIVKAINEKGYLVFDDEIEKLKQLIKSNKGKDGNFTFRI